MRIAIVGSRDFTDYEKVEQEVLKHIKVEKIDKVVSGGQKAPIRWRKSLPKNTKLRF
jgi:hypothetical protein